jgi:hypothetical protein
MYLISADLCSCITFSKFHFNAEGLQIYLSGDRKDLDDMISALNDMRSALDGRLRISCCLAPASDSDFEFCCGHGAA